MQQAAGLRPSDLKKMVDMLQVRPWNLSQVGRLALVSHFTMQEGTGGVDNLASSRAVTALISATNTCWTMEPNLTV